MPRDEEKHRHRRRDASSDHKDRDHQQSHHKHSGRHKDDESSSRHHRKHPRHASDQEEEGKQQRDRKKSRRGEDKDDDSSSSISVRHGDRRKHGHRHGRQREEKIDRKKSDRKSEDRKKKKKMRKHSRRDDSSDDDEKDRKKSRKRATTATRVDKSTLFPMGDPVGSAPATLIDPETDYFTYHQEFWVYLFREEGVRFNDLQSDEARAAFARFAIMYNAGKLEAPYYDNPPLFPPQVLEESKTTRHEWGFQTSATERKGLEQLQEGVRRLTQYREDGDGRGDRATQPTRTNTNDMARKLDQGPSDGRHKKTPEELLEEHRSNRRLRESVRTAQEEVTGGAKDFRDRQVEKKREQADRMHGAARDKEEGGAGVELSDAAVYGDGDRSFQQALAQERQSKAKREERRNTRLEELKNKEQERQSNMLKLLGLDGMKPGQKIQIAPRKDG